jgi:hypothetical protein
MTAGHDRVPYRTDDGEPHCSIGWHFAPMAADRTVRRAGTGDRSHR